MLSTSKLSIIPEDKYNAAQRYWKASINIKSCPIEIIGDYARGNSNILSHYSIRFQDDINNKVFNLCKNNDRLILIYFLSMFKVLIGWLISKKDILVFTKVFKENSYNKYIITQNEIDPNITIKELIFRVSENLQSVTKYQYFPIQDILELSHLESPGQLSRFFFSMDGLQKINTNEVFNELNLDILLNIKRFEESLIFDITYNSKIFKKSTIVDIFNFFENLCSKAISNNNQNLGKIIFEPSIIRNINRTTSNNDLTFIDLFKEAVNNFPDNTAVRYAVDFKQILSENSIDYNQNSEELSEGFKDIVVEELSYKELDELSNKFGNFLISKGISHNSIVGILLEPTIDLMVYIIGILKIGAVFLPIQPDIPVKRIKSIINDSDLKYLITNEFNIDLFKEDCEILNNDALDYYHHSIELDRLVSQDNFAYTIYTSGTTGNPKGVLINHKSLSNYIVWLKQFCNLDNNTKSVLLSSYAYDLGYSAIFPILISGGELHLLQKDIYLSTGQLVKYINDYGITFIKTTPSFLSTLLVNNNFTNGNCHNLRTLIIGGEKINVSDIRQISQIYPKTNIVNHYGPTEATIGCIAHKIDINDIENYIKQPIIGSPVFNTDAIIKNEYNQEMPNSVYGELCIAGHGVSEGYLNNPKLTHLKFSKSFSRNSKIYYYTGDIARYISNDKIEILGREDSQVKINGFRVELDEIINILNRHNQISNAHVKIANTESGAKQLEAYIVQKEETLFEVNDNIKSYFLENQEKCERKGILSLISELAKLFPEQSIFKNDESNTYKRLEDASNDLMFEILNNYNDRFKLTKDETIRYKRQELLQDWGNETQELLKSKTAFIAGAGGGASPTITQLALAGIGKIIICDYDEIELSNLNRQFLHTEERLGMNKAMSAKLTVNKINPNVEVIAISEKLNKENIEELIGEADIVYDMFDDLHEKFIISEFCVKKGIPHVIAAMTDICSYTAIFHAPFTPCFHCLFDKKRYNQLIEGMKNIQAEYQKNPLAVIASSLFTSTGFAVTESLKILLGFENLSYNRFFFFNQKGSKKITKSDSFKSMTLSFSNHFRRISKSQGFDWEIGWRGKFLEELILEKDDNCETCNNSVKDSIPTKFFKYNINSELKNNESKVDFRPVLICVDDFYDILIAIIAIMKSKFVAILFNINDNMEYFQSLIKKHNVKLIIANKTTIDIVNNWKIEDDLDYKILDISSLEKNKLSEYKFPLNKKQEIFCDVLNSQVLNYTHSNLLERVLSKDQDVCINSFTELSCKIFQILIRGGRLSSNIFNENSIKPSEIKEYLKEFLPDYMVPKKFKVVSHIPLNSNGKVAENELFIEEHEFNHSNGGKNSIESRMLSLWMDVLKVPLQRIDSTKNFFENGGNSLNIAELISKIQNDFNIEIPYKTAFENSKIDQLSSVISNMNPDSKIVLKTAERKEYYPLTYTQERFYFNQQLNNSEVNSLIHISFSISGNLDKERFVKSLETIIHRHESFRTSFKIINEKPSQVVETKLQFNVDYRQIREADLIEIYKEYNQPFDLDKLPLFRIGLFKIEKNNYVCFITMHHILLDAYSFNIFSNELLHEYSGMELNRAVPTFKDYAAWVNSKQYKIIVNKQRNFWVEFLKNCIPRLNLPFDEKRQNTDKKYDYVEFVIDDELYRQVLQISRNQDCTLYTVILSFIFIFLSKICKQEEVLIASPVSGRTNPRTQNIIGCFINTILLKATVNITDSYVEFLKNVNRNILEVLNNQEYPFNQLMKEIGLRSKKAEDLGFNVLFSWNNNYKVDIDLDELTIRDIEIAEPTTKVPLTIAGRETDKSIEFRFIYDTSLFDMETINLFCARMQILIENIIENIDTMISSIDFQTELESTLDNIGKSDFDF